MSTQKNNFYTSVNQNGYLCAYDCATHKCISIMLATGMDIERYNQECKRCIGKIDPKHKK
ncbi:MAG: hypothetical protein ACI4G1_05485 [Ruminococcus sp.]